jgi:hypothetical protein
VFYDFAITVPKERTEASPVTQVMKLTQGVITRVEVQFPNGCAGLAHCKILHEESQKWPTPPSTSMASDGHAIVIDENFGLDTEPYQLKAVCWNDDDTYSHTIYVRVGVLRGEIAVMILKVFQGLEKMLKLMGVK